MKELGVTHIEVLPFHDFAGVDELSPDQSYNWGYNPLHFNAPEGSYSLDPQNPKSRIAELKTMIQTLHKHGFSVIMDAVYNHVYKRETSPFEKTVPGYFFRHNEYGFPADGTGVGNDIASERLMVRKYILDSVRYWLEEYDVDGIRFDLMGILDIETVRQISKLAENVKPGALLFGEGWDLNTPLESGQKATLQNAGKVPAVGFFNDRFRNAVKGSTFELGDRGYALGDTGKKLSFNMELPAHRDSCCRHSQSIMRSAMTIIRFGIRWPSVRKKMPAQNGSGKGSRCRSSCFRKAFHFFMPGRNFAEQRMGTATATGREMASTGSIGKSGRSFARKSNMCAS